MARRVDVFERVVTDAGVYWHKHGVTDRRVYRCAYIDTRDEGGRDQYQGYVLSEDGEYWAPVSGCYWCNNRKIVTSYNPLADALEWLGEQQGGD